MLMNRSAKQTIDKCSNSYPHLETASRQTPVSSCSSVGSCKLGCKCDKTQVCLQPSYSLHDSCHLLELLVKVLQRGRKKKESQNQTSNELHKRHYIHLNKYRPGTVEWSSQKTSDKSVQRAQRSSAVEKHMGS